MSSVASAGNQRPLVYNQFLPYFLDGQDKLESEARNTFQEIKANLGRAVLLSELKPGALIWTVQLQEYVHQYGFSFSKEDHVALVQLMYHLCTLKDLEPSLMSTFAETLDILLKKTELLTPEDLELPWRPLYLLFKKCTYDKESRNGMFLTQPEVVETLGNAIRACRMYFPKDSTKEMMEEWRPLLCPFSTVMAQAVYYMVLFLPTHHPDAFKLWLPDLQNLWESCHNAPSWEVNFFSLLSHLVSENPDAVDWEPYFPRMYSYFLNAMGLPVAYKSHSKIAHQASSGMVTTFIVHTLGNGSRSQDFLEKMLATLETYFHPANYGSWCKKLQQFLANLTVCFVDRLHDERYRKPSWDVRLHATPLTDSDVTRFVMSLKPLVLSAMFSQLGPLGPAVALGNLACLRPSLIIPPVLDRLHLALDMVNEPHRLTAAIECATFILRAMVSGGAVDPPLNCSVVAVDETENWTYPEGPSHLMPLLMAILPGINPNDTSRCIAVCQFIIVSLSLVPIVDCSALADKGFKEFVLRFLDQTFALVESRILLESMSARDEPTSEEYAMNNGIALSFFTMLSQASLPVFQVALDKVQGFISGRILETKVAGKIVANLCYALARVRPEISLKVLLPSACSTILGLLDNDYAVKEENLDPELLFKLQLTYEIVHCSGNFLLPYEALIKQVLDKVLHLTSMDGSKVAADILENVLKSLSRIIPNEYRSLPEGFDRKPEEYDYVKDWGRTGDIERLHIDWHVPSEQEIKLCQDLLHRYLEPEMKRIEKHITDAEEGSTFLTCKELQQSLKIIMQFITGCSSLLPFWVEDDPLEAVVDSCVQNPYNIKLCIQCNNTKLTTSSGKNVRQEILYLMQRLQKQMLLHAQDDTKSLNLVLKIYASVLYRLSGLTEEDFDALQHYYYGMKRALGNELVRQKKHSRALLIKRVHIQHETRLFEAAANSFTESHLSTMNSLLDLATSRYSQIRSHAQKVLQECFSRYPYSYRTMVPRIVHFLRDPSHTHEELKGAMFVAIGKDPDSMLVCRNWQDLSILWPALLSSPPTEKPSIVHLLADAIVDISDYWDTFNIEIRMSEATSSAAKKLLATISDVLYPSEEQVADGKSKLQENGKRNISAYESLVRNLTDAINSGELHRCYESSAYSLLSLLIRSDYHFPPGTVQVFLQGLIHNDIAIRKMSTHGFSLVLMQLKRPHSKKMVDPHTMNVSGDSSNAHPNPGLRPDNEWLQYDEKRFPRSPKDWDSPLYLYKGHYGYYTWPRYLGIYAPSGDQPKLDRTADEMSPAEREIQNFFTDQSNVDQLITFLSLEEEKGKDKFDDGRFVMFKGLFRNFGNSFLDKFVPHLERLVADQSESSQRCAAEILSGLIRGSKHWPYEKVEEMWRILVPIIQVAMANVTTETICDWGSCCGKVSISRDPNRIYWFLELLMEELFTGKEGAFVEASRLYMLQVALNMQMWRVEKLLGRLLNHLRPHLAHPFQNARLGISNVLANIFMYDVTYAHGQASRGPHGAALAEALFPQLAVLIESGGAFPSSECSSSDSNSTCVPEGKTSPRYEGERKSALLLLKTVGKWIADSFQQAYQGAKPYFWSFLPILCGLENHETDPEVGDICSSAISCLAQARLLPEQVGNVLGVVKEVAASPSWHCRASILEYMEVMVFKNLCLLPSREEWMTSVKTVVLELLGDPSLEVRNKAERVLSGMLHCKFIPISQDLLTTFRERASVPLMHGKLNSEAVIRRHSGILGLCAVVNAHPYSVPDIVPEIIMVLGDHLHDPEPILPSITKTLNEFRHTHQDNWQEHKKKFSEDQLEVLADMMLSPGYYA